MAIIDKDWNPEHHYGITRKRAIELGEDAEYPRVGAAVFHFDELTPEEQQTVIKHKKEELVEVLDDRKRVYAEAKKSAQTSRALHVDPRGMNPFPQKKKQIKKRIEMLQKSIDGMSERVSKPVKDTPKQKPLKDMTKSELKKLRVILHHLPDGTMEIKEKGTDSLERGVASWNPPNRPDMTEHSRVGGYIMNENVADNAKKWLDTVAENYDLDMDEIVAQSWRGGGMRHKASPYDYTANTFTGKVKRVSGSKATKVSKAPWRMTNAEFFGSFYPPASYEWYKAFGWPEGYTYNQNPEYRRLTGHHAIVKTAVDKGLPVPTRVLADYPDLEGKKSGFLSTPTPGFKRALRGSKKAKAKPKRRTGKDNPTSVRGIRR